MQAWLQKITALMEKARKELPAYQVRIVANVVTESKVFDCLSSNCFSNWTLQQGRRIESQEDHGARHTALPTTSLMADCGCHAIKPYRPQNSLCWGFA